ncbi:MAG: NAD(P)-dependent glycerol-3-phosphate dehydrogenase [Clostridia bacterium]|nr:NAD(P)-dependent glycerol-3-phosphate dehydrogenase [Clostridia bacterium]
MKITVLGTGTWGTALAQVLSDNGNDVVMYGIDKGEIDDINAHRNTKYFDDVVLPESITATDDLESALCGAELMLVAVPTKFVASVLMQTRPYINESIIVVNASKGFDPNTNNRMTDTIRRVIGDIIKTPVVSVIGPSHAEEVILRRLTSICAVSVDEAAARHVQQIFSNSYMRLYVNTDEIGAEYSSAMKNVIALASGMLVGLGYGDNAKAALVTRGLAEMARYASAKGGRAQTLVGLTGVGDLVVTCFSVHSRNYQAGLYIGKHDSVEEFFKENKKTVEGIYSCKVVYEDLQSYDFEMPITRELYKILFEGKRPSQALVDIMERPLKDERK